MYRQTWYKNHLVFRDMAGILSELQAAGVPVMVVKGAALILRYHRDFGARPMDDFDVVVPTDRAARALEVLRERGWRTDRPLTEYRMRAFNGMNMHDGQGRQLDLHWHLLAEDCRPDADADFWSAAGAVDLHGTLRAGPASLRPALARLCPRPPLERGPADPMDRRRRAHRGAGGTRSTGTASSRQPGAAA